MTLFYVLFRDSNMFFCTNRGFDNLERETDLQITVFYAHQPILIFTFCVFLSQTYNDVSYILAYRFRIFQYIKSLD